MYIIDEHIHVSPEFKGDYVLEIMDRTNTEKAVLQSVFHTSNGPLTALSLELKKQNANRFFIFGALNASLYYTEKDIGKAQIKYLEPFLDKGIDGIKLLEGKPPMRKKYGVPPFDSEEWEPLFDFLEKNNLPITWHVNDPENHWSKDVSPWVIKQGWAYDESFVNNEEQYREVINVIDRHKGLKVIFAHFFFMSACLERLGTILDEHPNVYVDVTPGIEMYENFSKNPEKARVFFEKYHDRIIYGTDIGGRCILTNEGCSFNEKENLRRPEIVRYFLSEQEKKVIYSDGNFLIDRKPFEMVPLGLQGERLEEIYHKNFERVLGFI